MYKLLIVEDEAIMREGLSRTIPWQEWGFEAVGAAEDGRKALALLEERQADLVLTDIRMPGMDGLELLQSIRKRFRETQVILLSGYEDFEYVRRGLSLGAAGYVLKMNLLAELKPAVLQVKDLLDREREAASRIRADETAHLAYRLQESLRLLLLGNRAGGEAFDRYARSAVGAGLRPRYVAALLYANNYFVRLREHGAARLDEQTAALERAAGQALASFGLPVALVRVKENEWAAAVLADSAAHDVARRVRERLSELAAEAPLPLAAAVGEPCGSSAELRESYRRARLSLLGQEPGRPTAGETPPKPEALADKESRLMSALEMGDREAAMGALGDWFRLWRSGPEVSIARLREICLQLIGSASWRIKELYGAGADRTPALADIVDYEDVGALEQWMEARVGQLLVQARDVQESETESRIARIVAYIQANCHERITLKTMAEYVYLNPSYLSVVFKERTGKSFTDFVIETKMNKAAAYLAEGLKVQQAAEKVGYEDPKHFRQMFHKFIGVNPGDYR